MPRFKQLIKLRRVGSQKLIITSSSRTAPCIIQRLPWESSTMITTARTTITITTTTKTTTTTRTTKTTRTTTTTTTTYT